MTETAPFYQNDQPPPDINRSQLRIQIALFLQQDAGDHQAARELLTQALTALEQAEAMAQCVGYCQHRLEALCLLSQRHFARTENVLTFIENLMSDGK
jgi:hypothetical protein